MVQNMEVNVSALTEAEQELILEVLRRDEELRRSEEQRVKKLKNELLEVRRKGAKRGSGSYSERSCGRCQETMGFLAGSSSQCRACKHHVCKKCQSVRPNGSWVCTVCAKEIDLKMSTGDWFYDERVNRFSTAPGHDLVQVSLRKRPLNKKLEIAGEKLLNADVDCHRETPVPKPRLAHANSSSPQKVDKRLDVQKKDGELSDQVSLGSSNAETGSFHSVSPKTQRKEGVADKTSPADSTESSPGRSTAVETASLIHHMNSCSDSLGEVDRLFKKSVRRVHKLSEMKPVSTLDLRREGTEHHVTSMGDRCKSVPGLNADEEEEDEDIDNLVNIHKQKIGQSSGSLGGSRTTLGSMTSVYSEAGDYDCVPVSGELVFSLSYDDSTQTLSVFLRHCCGLAYADAGKQKCNPYIKTYLFPDKSKRKTSVKRNTVNPSFNQTLKYSISRAQLATRALQISVWHHDRFGRNAFLGQVDVLMDNYNVDSGYEECVALRGKTETPSGTSPFDQLKGELVISLKYVTTGTIDAETASEKTTGAELHVLIKEARNLAAIKAGSACNSFVKGYLLPSKNKSSTKRKTRLVKKTPNPHYDHTFVYKDLSLEQLEDMFLELTVWDRETLSTNHFLGGVRLSSGAVMVKEGKEEGVADSSGEEVLLWKKMMKYPDSWAEGTLPLRSSLGRGK